MYPPAWEESFYQILSLHELETLEPLSQWGSFLPRGWRELDRLPMIDRIEFTQSYWQAKLSYMPSYSRQVEKMLLAFFDRVEEISIYVSLEKRKKPSPLQPHMIYSLRGGGFFQGEPPVQEKALLTLSQRFGRFELPIDYLAFLQIHEGFSQGTDGGLIRARDMARTHQKLQQTLGKLSGGEIDPLRIIAFYEAHLLHSYQCFYIEEESEAMTGNFYLADPLFLQDSLFYISTCRFPSFLDWLACYLHS